MIKESFPLRVLALSFLLLAVPILIDSFLFFKNSYEEATADAETDLAEAADFRAFAVAEIEPVKQTFLKELAVLLDLEQRLQEGDKEALSQELGRLSALLGNTEIFITDLGEGKQYTTLASSKPEFVGKTLYGYKRLENAIRRGEGDFFLYIQHPEEKRSVPHLIVMRKLRDPQTDQPYAILFVATNVEKQLLPLLSKDAAMVHDYRYNIHYALVSEEGVIFAAENPRLNGEMFAPLSPQMREQIETSQELGSVKLAEKPLPVIQKRGDDVFEFIFNNEVQLGFQSPLPRLGISVLAYSPKEEIFGRSIRRFLIVYALFGVILVGGGGITYWFTLYMAGPLQRLTRAMRQVGEGNLNVRFHEERLGFEINLLGQRFNETVESLLDQMQHAEDQRVKRERLSKELEIGLEVQQQLLPETMPDVPGVQLSARYLPAEQAGGDFYHAIKKEDGTVLLAVADAAGTGVSACLYALTVRSLLTTLATRYDTIGELLSEANDLFCMDTGESGNFLTLFAGIYNPETREWTYHSCGHVPGLLFRADGSLESLESGGIALGVEPSTGAYSTETLSLNPGDLLLLFSDGLYDTRNPQGEPFTLERVIALVREHRDASADTIATALADALKRFRDRTLREEEITLLAIRVV